MALQYGFMDLQALADRRVTEIGVSVIDSAIQASVDEHNRQISAITGLFAGMTTDHKTRFKTVPVRRSQPLDQNGRPRPIMGFEQYDVAFPIQDSGSAWGSNYKTRVKMTVNDANEITAAMLIGDALWLRDHILAALFANVAWTFVDPLHGNLTVKGLANGDTDTYKIKTGNDEGQTDTHYIAQANAIDNSNDPFDAIYNDIVEHPENSMDVLVLTSTSLKTSIRNLAGFIPYNDKNVQLGANITQLVGDLGISVPGTMIGYHESKVWLSEWAAIPAGYMLAVALGGDKALNMRQEPETELQGFRRVAEGVDFPFYRADYQRSAGFGAWNRVGALVYQVGSGSYSIPTGFENPMP